MKAMSSAHRHVMDFGAKAKMQCSYRLSPFAVGGWHWEMQRDCLSAESFLLPWYVCVRWTGRYRHVRALLFPQTQSGLYFWCELGASVVHIVCILVPPRTGVGVPVPVKWNFIRKVVAFGDYFFSIWRNWSLNSSTNVGSIGVNVKHWQIFTDPPARRMNREFDGVWIWLVHEKV